MGSDLGRSNAGLLPEGHRVDTVYIGHGDCGTDSWSLGEPVCTDQGPGEVTAIEFFEVCGETARVPWVRVMCGDFMAFSAPASCCDFSYVEDSP